jgi:endo-1,4-beta-xylanase
MNLLIRPRLRTIFLSVFLASALVARAQNSTAPALPPVPSEPAHEEPHPPSIPLWPNGAPGSESRRNEPEKYDWRQEPDIVFTVTSNIHNPSLTPYLPAKDKATGCAVVIAPGGGHMFLTTDREGYDLAQWLANHGIAAFVLKYRLAKDRSNPPNTPQPYQVSVHALADAQRALRLVRSRATEWGVNPDHVGIVGFSAGGEVAADLALQSGAPDPKAPDPVDRLDARPNFVALVYPGLPPELAASLQPATVENFPPTFLLCAADDRPAIANALPPLYLALKAEKIPVELIIYGQGGHGFGVRPRPLSVSGWPDLFTGWLGDFGFLKQ